METNAATDQRPSPRRLLSSLSLQPPDALLALIAAYRDDPRATKIDLGVGVYRDETGHTPIPRAVKAAERRLLDAQATKTYLGPEGDPVFVELLRPLVFGAQMFGDRLSGLQTPGGTGALRLAGELIATARPGARLHVGTPTWPNHAPIFAAAGLELVPYRYFDPQTQRICFDEMLPALAAADPGDVVLLHGCCHNPTGADLGDDQWAQVAALVSARHLVPLVDLAYQGLGRGLEPDAAGARRVVGAAAEALVAYSCDKNFGLYRERTGALFTVSESADSARATFSNLMSLARANWSMPPDHGAAVVRTILEDGELTADWRAELDTMRERIAGIRTLLAGFGGKLAPLAGQHGMFSTLALAPEQVRSLREAHGVFMAGSGRVNLAGLTASSAGRFAAALAEVAPVIRNERTAR